MNNKKPILGSHMSIAGGIEQAILRAQALNLQALQFFSKSNRQWKAKQLTPEAIQLFKQTLQASSIESTTIHASYLINIGSPDQEIAKKSHDALLQEYERAALLGVDHLVFHPGSHMNAGEPACLKRIAEHMNRILSKTTGSTQLVLETMAGQGTNVCYRFEQIAQVIENIEQKNRIGACLDTCHVFAAGYDLSNSYEAIIKEFETTIGLDKLAVIHINDSKFPLGSRRDRHEHIGQGKIGLEGFKKLLRDPRLQSISKILETPKNSDLDDIKNIKTLEKLYLESETVIDMVK